MPHKNSKAKDQMDTGTWLIVGIIGLFLFLGWSVTSTVKSIVSLPVKLANSLFSGLNNLLDAVVP